MQTKKINFYFIYLLFCLHFFTLIFHFSIFSIFQFFISIVFFRILNPFLFFILDCVGHVFLSFYVVFNYDAPEIGAIFGKQFCILHKC